MRSGEKGSCLRMIRTGVFLVLAVCMMIAVSSSYYAAIPAKVDKTHYVVANRLKPKKLKVYKDSTLAKKNGSANADQYYILQLTEKAAYVKYKEEGKTQKGWVSKKAFFIDTAYEALQSYAYTSSFTIFADPALTRKLVDVPAYSGGLTVGIYGGSYQVMFYVGGHYYLGWISGYTYQNKLRFSMDTTEAQLANGYYEINSPRKPGYALEWNSKDKTITLQKVQSASKNQKFYIESVTDEEFTVQTFNRKYYVSISQSGKLTLSKEARNWKLNRMGDYFGIVDVKSGKAIQLNSQKGAKLAVFSENQTKQMWNFSKMKVLLKNRVYTVFSQYDPKWGGTVYAQRNGFIRTISTSGCGVVAYVNAIYALNGQYIPPAFLSNYSNSNGHYVFNEGTADTLFRAFAQSYGSRYHFRYAGFTYSYAQMRQHLIGGGTVVTLVPGHFMAIVDYDPKTDRYMLLDSAITGTRPTNMKGDWVTLAQLNTGRLKCEHFHLFSAA